jgi:hypothetical protein
MTTVMGEPLEFMTKAMQLVQTHFPDRAEVILITNVRDRSLCAY